MNLFIIPPTKRLNYVTTTQALTNNHRCHEESDKNSNTKQGNPTNSKTDATKMPESKTYKLKKGPQKRAILKTFKAD
jgi:hypothetical protein